MFYFSSCIIQLIFFFLIYLTTLMICTDFRFPVCFRRNGDWKLEVQLCLRYLSLGLLVFVQFFEKSHCIFKDSIK